MIKILPTLILAQVFCAGCSRQQVHILPVVSGLDTVSAALEKVAEFRKGDVRTPVVLRLAPGDYTLTESVKDGFRTVTVGKKGRGYPAVLSIALVSL